MKFLGPGLVPFKQRHWRAQSTLCFFALQGHREGPAGSEPGRRKEAFAQKPRTQRAAPGSRTSDPWGWRVNFGGSGPVCSLS